MKPETIRFVHLIDLTLPVAAHSIDCVFVGGIGERSASMRNRICRNLGFLGLHLDHGRNDGAGANPTRINGDGATVQAWVIPTDEERQIAQETYSLLAGRRIRSITV